MTSKSNPPPPNSSSPGAPGVERVPSGEYQNVPGLPAFLPGVYIPKDSYQVALSPCTCLSCTCVCPPVLMASAVCIQRHTHLLGPVPGCVQDRLKLGERLGHCWGAAPPCCSLLSFRQGGLGCALRSARGILHFPKGSTQIRKRGHRTWSCERLTLALEPRKLIIYGMSLCPLDFTKLGPPFTHKP